MAGADREHGTRKREQALDQLRARAQHLDARSGAALEGGEVEAGREDALATAQHDDRARALGRVQRRVDLADHLARERVHLAVVERDPRDSVLDLDLRLLIHGPSAQPSP